MVIAQCADLLDSAEDDADIAPGDGMLLELLHEFFVCLIRLRNDEQP